MEAQNPFSMGQLISWVFSAMHCRNPLPVELSLLWHSRLFTSWFNLSSFPPHHTPLHPLLRLMSYLFLPSIFSSDRSLLVRGCSHLEPLYFLGLLVSSQTPPPWWDLIFPTSVSSCLLSVSLHWTQALWGSGLVTWTTGPSIPTTVPDAQGLLNTHALSARVEEGKQAPWEQRCVSLPLMLMRSQAGRHGHSKRSTDFCWITEYLLLWVPLPAC